MQRVALNLYSRRLEDDCAGALTQLAVSLGDPSLAVALRGLQLLPLFSGVTLIDAAELQFAANAILAGGAIDFDGDNIVSGAIEISVTPAGEQVLDLGEDWKSALLLALFLIPDQKTVSLKGQFRWHAGGEINWTHSSLFSIEVTNSLFAADFIPSASPIRGPYFYLDKVTALTGVSTALDRVRIAVLPNRTLLKIVIDGEGASEWRKESTTDPAPVTGNAIVVTVDFNSVTMPYVLVRQ